MSKKQKNKNVLATFTGDVVSSESIATNRDVNSAWV